ncbi:MAG TPA: hypothetical protein VFR09_01025 [Alphaproteobacteria bacterium]|nr:hypothetical protein [Alphaproteobacteria bacterium]
MRRWLLPCLLTLALIACTTGAGNGNTQFWRPISEPNTLMPLEKAQRKLDFDLSQCSCGIYPENMLHSDIVEFQSDHQRMASTGVAMDGNVDGSCTVQPSMVVSECMRGRGWETTNCSGRMPLPGGGSLCAGYSQ